LFRASPLSRSKHEGLQRNVAIAVRNQTTTEAKATTQVPVADDHPVPAPL